MSAIARTVYVFGLYLILLGIALLLVPGWLDALLGVDPEDNGWLRLSGLLAAVTGTLYCGIAVNGSAGLCRLTIVTRIGAAVMLAVLVSLGQLPGSFLVLAWIDAAGGLWTHIVSLRSGKAR
ncbi:hypothetical protein ACFFK0_13030 [Paenibacillus chartarius]|uniref:Uncharacterized protein n=1 Tax=Paenibacillus chartarius TaxID=747481 RepID=A0ABV6DL47_9BACL